MKVEAAVFSWGKLRPACTISRLLASAVFFCYETIIIIDIDCRYLRRYLSGGHYNEQNELCAILAVKGQRGFWVPHRYRHDDRGDVGRGTEWRFMTADGIVI